MVVCCHSSGENTHGLQDDLDWDPAICPPQAHASFPFGLISSLFLFARQLKPTCLVGLLTTSSSLKSTLSGESVRLIDHDIHLAIHPGLMFEGPVSSEQVSSLGDNVHGVKTGQRSNQSQEAHLELTANHHFIHPRFSM